MQLFIGRIPKSISRNELYRHFEKYGKIKDLNLRDSYGFITFLYTSDAFRALNRRHIINGVELNIEEAASRRKDSRDPPDRTRRMSPEYSPGYDRERSPCDYCDRCEKHGRRKFDFEDRKRRKFDFVNSKMKIVIDNLPARTSKHDLYDFAVHYGFNPVYTRITAIGNHGILEFKSVEERDDALLKLGDKTFLGSNITVRPYFQRELTDKFEEERRSEGKLENNLQEDIYGDLQFDNKNEENKEIIKEEEKKEEVIKEEEIMNDDKKEEINKSKTEIKN